MGKSLSVQFFFTVNFLFSLKRLAATIELHESVPCTDGSMQTDQKKSQS